MNETFRNLIGATHKPYREKLIYLESTGTQYIDTGIKPDFVNGDSIEISFFGIYMESGAKSVFGSRNMSSAKVVNGLYINGANIVFGDSEDYTTVPFDYRNEHILTINDTEIIDNGTTFAQTPRHISCDYPIYLFTLNDRNFQTIGNYDGMKLYDWKYYRNGVLAQHLIPVLDRNGTPCMYDEVSKTFFYNQGSGSFSYGLKRRLQYLESTGTQYIDTGIKPDFANGDKVEASFYKAEFTGTSPCIFGSRQSTVLNGLYVLGYSIVVADNSAYSTVAWNSPVGNYVMRVNDSAIQVNNYTYEMPKRVTCTYPMYLFALNSNNSMIVPYSGMKLYYWKYWKNGVLTQHLIPVLDKDGVPCMYDEVSKQFLYNKGSGTFNYK